MLSLITPDLITDLLRGALLPMAGAAGQSVVMIGEEWIKLWKMEQAVIVGQKAVNFLNSRGITDKEQLRKITTKFGLLFIEGASVENIPELQELWAKLLANALDANFAPHNLHPAFIQIIKGLEPNDAKILQHWYSILKTQDPANQIDLGAVNVEDTQIMLDCTRRLDMKECCEAMSMNSKEYELSVYNLMRVQCVTPFMQASKLVIEGKSAVVSEGATGVSFTPFGLRFVKACIA